MIAAACVACRRAWSRGDEAPAACPWCGGALETVRPDAAAPVPSPARVLAPTIDARAASAALREALSAVPHPGPELLGAPAALQLVWLPWWSVSAEVRSVATASLAHADPTAPPADGWASAPWVRAAPAPARTRWQPCAARIERTFDDLPVEASAPATGAPPRLRDAGPAVAPERDGPWLLPSRGPRERIPELTDALRAAVGETLAAAAGAERAVDVALSADPFAAPPRWTLALNPVWIAHYRDDDGQVRTLTVDGATGAWAGPRLGSRAVASAFAGRQTAIGLPLIAFAAFLALAGVILWLLLPVSALLGLLGLRLLLTARAAGPSVGGWNRAELRRTAAGPEGTVP